MSLDRGKKIFDWTQPLKEFFHTLGNGRIIFIALILFHFLLGAFIPPLLTSDFKRNLFYGKAFWKYGFEVYDMRPINITGTEYNITDPLTGLPSYPNTTYDYPTIQLIFWAIVSLLPYPEILAKWILSIFDIMNINFMIILLLQRQKENFYPSNFEKLFIFSYLLTSIPFSAIEGQGTSITIFFLLLPVIIHRKNIVLGYFSIGIGFHWKYISFLILPYLVCKDRNEYRTIIIGIFALILAIILLSIPPLSVSLFVLRYFGFFGKLGEYSGQTISNPLLITHLSISSILSTFILILTVFYWLGGKISKEGINFELNQAKSILDRGYWIPFLLLLSFLKIYSTAFPWYWMWFFPCITILPRVERKNFFILLLVTFIIGLIDFIDITVGFGDFLDYLNRQ